MKQGDLVRALGDFTLENVRGVFGDKKIKKDSILLIVSVRHYAYESIYEMMYNNKIHLQRITNTAISGWEQALEVVSQ